MSGGCDSLVKVWREGEDGHWTEEAKLEAHSDWVSYRFFIMNYSILDFPARNMTQVFEIN